jgi:hypothetical protein
MFKKRNKNAGGAQRIRLERDEDEPVAHTIEEAPKPKQNKFKNRRSNLCFKEAKVEVDENMIVNSPESIKEEIQIEPVVHQPPLLPPTLNPYSVMPLRSGQKEPGQNPEEIELAAP